MTLDPSIPLDARLLEFAEAMKAKFERRAEKQRKMRGGSVTDADYEWAGLPELRVGIPDHADEEIVEWRLDVDADIERARGLLNLLRTLPRPSELDREDECLDVANMMFLDWAQIREARDTRPPAPMAAPEESQVECVRAREEEFLPAEEWCVTHGANWAWDARRCQHAGGGRPDQGSPEINFTISRTDEPDRPRLEDVRNEQSPKEFEESMKRLRDSEPKGA